MSVSSDMLGKLGPRKASHGIVFFTIALGPRAICQRGANDDPRGAGGSGQSAQIPGRPDRGGLQAVAGFRQDAAGSYPFQRRRDRNYAHVGWILLQLEVRQWASGQPGQGILNL